MLIVPIENKPEWSKPPFITIALILINFVVFVFYQGTDNEIADRAMGYYQQHELLEFERDYYLDYSESEHPELAENLQQITASDERDAFLSQHIFFDRGFDRYLQSSWNNGSIALTTETESWPMQRQEFEQQRNRISSIAAGLTPAEAHPLAFITNQFLHGGWGHLLGNMVFLFLFGFTLETVLRPYQYLLMYLASGVAANLLHLALNSGSYIPVIGASGAISGLMGMYLALYRLRKIRFFYSFLFYFGEFTAPALFILPLWLAKELYGHFFTESNTAYWAHIGGLLAGVVMMFFARRTQQEFSQEQESKSQDDAFGQLLKRIQQAMSNMDFARARILARQACEQQPFDARPWRYLYDISKSQPQSKQFHEAVFNLLKQFVSRESPYANWQADVDEVLQQYQALHPKAPALTGNLSLALANKFWQNNAMQAAEEFLQRAQQQGIKSAGMIKLLTQMASYYQQRQQSEKAGQIIKALKQLQKSERPTITE